MRRLFPFFFVLLLVMGNFSPAWTASPKATALRQANDLTAFTPSEKFLAVNFVAAEMNPAFIFGTVKAFAASRKCPTAWLIEEGAQNRPTGPGSAAEPAESTVYLEEDCPKQVVYYVFIDQSGMTPQQWFEWRRKFHGRTKTEPEFGSTKSRLEQACAEGCGIGAELRFVQKNGELLSQSPEAYLRDELKVAPIYDLSQGKKIAQ